MDLIEHSLSIANQACWLSRCSQEEWEVREAILGLDWRITQKALSAVQLETPPDARQIIGNQLVSEWLILRSLYLTLFCELAQHLRINPQEAPHVITSEETTHHIWFYTCLAAGYHPCDTRNGDIFQHRSGTDWCRWTECCHRTWGDAHLSLCFVGTYFYPYLCVSCMLSTIYPCAVLFLCIPIHLPL